MFELQRKPAPAGLAALGDVEVRELGYGAMREAMSATDKPGQSAERLLAASLHVNGEPLGYEALQQLPGRFAGAIAASLEVCLRLHGLTGGDPETPGPNE